MEINKYIGNKIRELREKRNLTQEEIAEYLETTPQTISRYEIGDRKTNQDILFKLAEYFRVSINEFFPPSEYNQIEINTLENFIQENNNMMSQYRVLFDKDNALTDEQKKFIIDFLEEKHRKIDNNEDIND